jgi:GntR family transcriptional regulator
MQVKELLRLRIAENVVAEDDHLPSERLLAAELGISRMTVRQAVRELIDEGLVFTAPGRGTYRVLAKVAQPLDHLTGFSQDMVLRRMVPSSRLLSAGAMTDVALAGILGIASTAPIARIQRVRLADGTPMALETSHLPLNLCPGIVDLDLEHRSLYEILQGVYRLQLKAAEQMIEARVAERSVAELLCIEPGSPVLYNERRTQLEDGRLVEFVQSWYRGDRYQFRIRLPGPRRVARHG